MRSAYNLQHAKISAAQHDRNTAVASVHASSGGGGGMGPSAQAGDDGPSWTSYVHVRIQGVRELRERGHVKDRHTIGDRHVGAIAEGGLQMAGLGWLCTLYRSSSSRARKSVSPRNQGEGKSREIRDQQLQARRCVAERKRQGQTRGLKCLGHPKCIRCHRALEDHTCMQMGPCRDWRLQLLCKPGRLRLPLSSMAR